MFGEVSNEQARQFVDITQVFEAARSAEQELRRRYAGTMAWKQRQGRDYLYRKSDGIWKSLGARSEQTEQTHSAFMAGKEQGKERLKGAQTRLREMAPVARALGLNRVPLVAARILRHLDKTGLLGRQVRIVGTNALFAYEASMGVRFRADILATGDIDLLFDARKRVRLAAFDVAPDALIRILRRADKSLSLLRAGDYRLVNRDGYMVDLIAPAQSSPSPRSHLARSIGDPEDDLVAAEIESLVWLENAPSIEQTIIGQDGLPARMVCPDPRAFAAHKLWLADQPTREPLKRRRDRAQADALISLIGKYRPTPSISDSDLTALPKELHERLMERAIGPR